MEARDDLRAKVRTRYRRIFRRSMRRRTWSASPATRGLTDFWRSGVVDSRQRTVLTAEVSTLPEYHFVQSRRLEDRFRDFVLSDMIQGWVRRSVSSHYRRGFRRFQSVLSMHAVSNGVQPGTWHSSASCAQWLSAAELQRATAPRPQFSGAIPTRDAVTVSSWR
jgi:hypothetical protein